MLYLIFDFDDNIKINFLLILSVENKVYKSESMLNSFRQNYRKLLNINFNHAISTDLFTCVYSALVKK